MLPLDGEVDTRTCRLLTAGISHFDPTVTQRFLASANAPCSTLCAVGPSNVRSARWRARLSIAKRKWTCETVKHKRRR
jgi:hypothetical protein